ncbi:class I SAM-dependent methyltransferase [Caulobacter sp. AP07]|uniref:class I SAM-dependent methyltransferase n=1 Tax=Caulobacter sp. AP07 TaxID=1144304 RepID=UPI0012FAA916|nr:class I SAM-dependent methyltransferase [Caulobacter sp. AP07]
MGRYVQQACDVYNHLANGVDEYCGGFDGKVVLDLGVGFQLIHGGLTLPLAIRAGASRCFGIDIASPGMHSSEPNKVEFWKAAKEMLSVDVQGLDEGRVYFASTDILHFDDFFSRIELLQMSASNMWFRDDMFDLVISNAVFEHVQNPHAVLKEMYRILKPGGTAYIHWNPFTGFRMGGHDIGMPFHYPWAHLRLKEKEHVKKLGEIFRNPDLFSTAFPPEHSPTAERAAIYAEDPGLFYKQIGYDLNRMRISEFLAYATSCGFEIAHSGFHCDESEKKYLTDDIRRELAGYSDEELLTIFHSAALRKPMQGRVNVNSVDGMKSAEPAKTPPGQVPSLARRLVNRGRAIFQRGRRIASDLGSRARPTNRSATERP